MTSSEKSRRSTDDFIDRPVPAQARLGKWSVTMAYWAMFSAVFWMVLASATAESVGVRGTIIGMALSVVSFGVINTVFAHHATRTGLSVELLSRRLFGLVGSLLAPLIFAATALYYGVFEGSIIAETLKSYFGGSLRLWYLVVVLYALPLVARGVRHWLDRLNGFLLPFYLAGLVAVVVAATVRHGYPVGWLSATAHSAGPLPGWLSCYLIYMGLWVMVMYTYDFARLGKPSDAKFLGRISFGWIFYLFTFGLNGLVSIYIMSVWHIANTEIGVVQAIISSLGGFGVALVLISQTRINTANYYMASVNLESFAARMLRLRAPRIIWVVVCGVLAYLFMLTNVLSYLLTALAWQGVFVTAWVAIALVHIVLHRRSESADIVAAMDTVTGRKLTWGTLAWLVASGIGLFLIQQTALPGLAQLGPVITAVLAAGLYYGGAATVRYRAKTLTPVVDVLGGQEP